MSNMSYCRFRNTLQDLQDCVDNFEDPVSPEEHRARRQMWELANTLVQDFPDGAEELPVED
jgi:hypothetical protein